MLPAFTDQAPREGQAYDGQSNTHPCRCPVSHEKEGAGGGVGGIYMNDDVPRVLQMVNDPAARAAVR